jgi:hypothetical protein
MAKQTPRDVLKRIADNGQAMSVLDQIAAEDHQPAKIHPYEEGNPLRGTLITGPDGTPEDPGTPGRSLGDLVREVLG